MSASDTLTYDKALEQPSNAGNPFVDKEMMYIYDTQNGVYNTQITFDSTSLANSGKWVDYSAGYIEIPFTISLQSSTDLTNAGADDYVNGFMIGLKNGTHHLIDSIQVDMNNTNCVQIQAFSNLFIGYKLMSSWSQDDLNKYGASILFNPDSAGSVSLSAGAASANGDGVSNNTVYSGALTYNSQIAGSNQGLLKRLQMTSFEQDFLSKGYNGFNASYIAAGNLQNVGKNYVSDNGEGTTNKVWTWNILATIRLKDLSDFFDKLPIVKCALMRININYNACSGTITTVAAGPTMVLTSYTQTAGRTCPIMISSSAANQPSNSAVAHGGGGVFSFSCGVGSTSNPTGKNSILTQCRLYVPSYALSAADEAALLATIPEREVVYDDIQQNAVFNVAPNQSFNSILTNGLVNPKSLVVIPMLNPAKTGIVLGTINEFQSPFDSAPGTTAPLASIANFNAQIGGRNLLQQNFQYDYENFFNEVSQMNALNGGLTTGCSSGLIDQFAWDNAYRYYVVDIARRSGSEDKVAKSIVVLGQNNLAGTYNVDYYCFMTFERRIVIDMRSGALKL